MDEKPHREPKISLVIALLGGIFILILDLLDIIPGLGYLTSIIAAPIIFYLYSIGVSGISFIIAEFLDMFPLIQEFPSRSIAWWLTVGIDHFAPAEVTEKLEKAGELMQAGANGVGTEGTVVAGAAEGQAVAVEGKAAVGATGGAVTAEGTASEKVGKKPSERTPEERAGAGGEGTEEGSAEDEGGEEAAEKVKKEQEAEKQLKMGAEIEPEEEMSGELFSPKETEFKEAKRVQDIRPQAHQKDQKEEDKDMPRAA